MTACQGSDTRLASADNTAASQCTLPSDLMRFWRAARPYGSHSADHCGKIRGFLPSLQWANSSYQFCRSEVGCTCLPSSMLAMPW